jgi:hypothetical protein
VVDAAPPSAAAEASAARGELARYGADYLASRAPLGASLLAGAGAALGVYAVPILVVAASFLLPNLAYAVVAPVSRLVVRVLRPGSQGQPPPPPRTVPDPTPALAVPTAGVEGTLDGAPPGALGTPGASGGEWWAVALVVFWPLAMVVVGLVVGAVYRARRARQGQALARHPVDVSILPEVLLFYALTAGAALLVRLDGFVALGANAIFAWAGFVIWRWLYDRLLPRLVPDALRLAVAQRVAAEEDFRRRQREAG